MEEELNDKITLKQLILTIQEYWTELSNKWLVLLLIAIPFIAFNIFKTYTSPPKYITEIKFFVEGDGGSTGGLGGILGSFGIRSGGGKNNPYQILEVLQSEIFILEILLEKDDKGALLANRIIEQYSLVDIWSEKNKEFKSNSSFKIRDIESDKHNELEKIALKKLIHRVSSRIDNQPLRTVGYEEDKGFYFISANTTNQDISLDLINISFEKIKSFFEQKTLKGYLDTRNIMKAKVDSLNVLISNKIYEMNSFGDSNRDLVSLRKGTRLQILQKDITALSVAQGEALKTYEMADFNYLNKKNQFMVIDRPILPILPEEESMILNILKGAFLGLLIGAIIILIRKVINTVMKSED